MKLSVKLKCADVPFFKILVISSFREIIVRYLSYKTAHDIPFSHLKRNSEIVVIDPMRLVYTHIPAGDISIMLHERRST